MKRTLTFLTLLLVAAFAFGQQDDPNSRRNLLLGGFSGSYGRDLRREVLVDLVGIHRFNVYEESVYDNLPRDTRQKIQLHGVVTGQVKNVKTERKTWETKASDGTVKRESKWETELEWTLTITDPQTREVLRSENFSNFGEHPTDRSKSEADAVSGLGSKVIYLFENYYPVRTTVLTIDESNKGKAKGVTIAVGGSASVYKGMEMTVYVQDGGRWNSIGELKIKEINSATQSSCSVEKGGKEILSAFEEGREMRAVSHAVSTLKSIFSRKKMAPRLEEFNVADNTKRNIVLGTFTSGMGYAQSLFDQVAGNISHSSRANIYSMKDYNSWDNDRRASVHGILSGYIYFFDVTSERLENYKKETYTEWKATLRWLVYVVDPVTGEQKYQGFRSGEATSDESRDKAVEKAIERASSGMDYFLYQSYPIGGTILTLDEADKKKAKRVTVDLGEDAAIYTGLQFAVFAEDATSEWEYIGRVEVTDASDKAKPQCKVTDGGAEIKKALEEGSANRIVSFKEVTF